MRAILMTLVMASSVGFATDVLAQDRTVGVGLQVGDTSGVTTKLHLDWDDAVQVAFGFRPPNYAWNGPGPTLTVDWLRQFVSFGPSSESVRFGFYLGLGGGLGWANDGCYSDAWGRRYCDDTDFVGVAARVPTGFTTMFRDVPVELYAELAPGIRLVPRAGALQLSGAMGGRFYF